MKQCERKIEQSGSEYEEFWNEEREVNCEWWNWEWNWAHSDYSEQRAIEREVIRGMTDNVNDG
jgi:hypothetical protein